MSQGAFGCLAKDQSRTGGTCCSNAHESAAQLQMVTVYFLNPRSQPVCGCSSSRSSSGGGGGGGGGGRRRRRRRRRRYE